MNNLTPPSKISAEIELICRKVKYESEHEDKCMWIEMFTQQRYNNDKVQRGHTGFTGHYYKTKYTNHWHKKGKKSIFNKTIAKQNPNIDKEMTMQILEAFTMPNR